MNRKTRKRIARDIQRELELDKIPCARKEPLNKLCRTLWYKTQSEKYGNW
jgi:hypothetical protein